MDDKIRQHLEWITCEIKKYESYHNHKELMAWLITAFSVTGIITIGLMVDNTHMLVKVGATVAILLGVFLVWLFVNMQFRKRWQAADFQLGLMRFASHLCCNSVNLPKEPEYTHVNIFPDHIWRYIQEVEETRTIGLAVKDLFRRPCSLDDRWKTELSSYGLIIIATVIALTALWAF